MNPYVPMAAHVSERHEETADVLTFTLELDDPQTRREYRFAAGQFNMLYVAGVGEVPISIVSDPSEPQRLVHTVRIVGHVTEVMRRWQPGTAVGVRGPFGRGWPLERAQGRDLVVVTGGLGCAPVAGAIEYVLRRRDDYGELHILHGVKTAGDLLYSERFQRWATAPRTQVYLTADRPDAAWHYRVGVVTNLFDDLRASTSAVVFMCGPEVMMRFAARRLLQRGHAASDIYVSLERNMKCAVGICGHCQLGGVFACKDGPVFDYERARPIFEQDAR